MNQTTKNTIPLRLTVNHKLDSYRSRFALVMVLVAVIVILIVAIIFRQPADPIPKSILSAVPYPVYYPDQNRLPAGYNFKLSSVQLVKPNVVFYAIDYAKQQIIVSEQVMPGNSVINHFTSDYIPLHTSVMTAIGTAVIGAYNDNHTVRTVLSLPVTNGPWLIVTAPANINQPALDQVLNSLIKG